MCSTYGSMVINRILDIDVWKNQWLLVSTLNATPFRISLFFVIEQVHREEASYRRAKDSYWIHTVRSLAPDRFNLDS